MSIETDAQGRLYLPSELREKYGERFHVVEYRDRIALVPIAEEPLSAVRAAVSHAFEDESAEALREEAPDRAREQAVAGLDRGRPDDEDPKG